MALDLGPGGRFALVIVGLGIAWLGFDRAGWTPDSWPHLFPPEPESVLATESAPEEPRPLRRGFVYAGVEETCVAPVNVVAVWSGAVPAGFAHVPAASGREALLRLLGGGADAAVVSVSELVASWDVAARASARIAAVMGDGARGLAVSTRIADERGLETARIAAVPGSAEEYLALGILARAGVRKHWLVPADDAGAALALFASGKVDGAAAPLAAIEPLVRAGEARLLGGPRPLDPAVWVVAGGRCLPAVPDGGPAVLDLPAAWAAALRIRAPDGGAPEDVLGLLDRPLLRAFLASGGEAR